MSDPAPSADPDIDPGLGLQFSLAHLLVPLFQPTAVDTRFAYQTAIGAIEAYHPESRADFVNAARIVALSMTTIALLGAAAAPDVPMEQRLRAFSRANALNRSADQTERTMMQRRRYHHANASTEQPAPEPAQPPETPIDEAAAQAEIAEIVQVCRAAAPPAREAPAPASILQRVTSQPQAQLPPPVAPPASAIHHRVAGPEGSVLWSIPFRELQLPALAVPQPAAPIAAHPQT